MVLYGWFALLTFTLSNRSYMEDRYIIYLHVNKINNKVYVGITKHSNPELRWRCGYKNNSYFNYSIKKYGWDGFEHIVLFRNLPKEIACKLEVKLISRYRKKGIFTEEGKKRIYSAVSKAKSVPVLCYSLDWIFIRKYKSISEANMSFNKEAKRPDIYRACRDSTKSAYGYRWRYEGKEVNNG